MYYYSLIEHHENHNEIFVSSNMNSNSIKDIIFFIQAKVNMDISEDVYLKKEDVVQLLVDIFDCKRLTVIDSSKPIEVIDLVQLWNENIERVESIIVNQCIDNVSTVEDAILNIIESKYSEKFIFINASLKMPKWAENLYFESLTLQVTHGGVLIQGLRYITERERKKIQAFYPACKFYDVNSLFFSFNDFPPYQYSFSWNGKHISVMQVKESDDEPTEIIKQMNIGYYLKDVDLGLPIHTKKELQIYKRKMRIE